MDLHGAIALAIAAYEARPKTARLLIACPVCGRRVAEVFDTSRGPLFVGQVPPDPVDGGPRSTGANAALDLELLTDTEYIEAAHGGLPPEPATACPKACADWRFDVGLLLKALAAPASGRDRGRRRRVIADTLIYER